MGISDPFDINSKKNNKTNSKSTTQSGNRNKKFIFAIYSFKLIFLFNTKGLEPNKISVKMNFARLKVFLR